MKKLDFFFLMVLICAIGMVGCSQQDSVSEPAEKTAEVEISISKAELLKSGAVDDTWYCPADLPSEGEATVSYTVKVYEPNQTEPVATDDTQSQTAKYAALNSEGQIQTKITLNWKDFYPSADGDEHLTIEVTAVSVSDVTIDDQGNKGTYTFAAPNTDALYASYIPEASQIGRETTVLLYQKVYMDVKVLCFNKQDIPEFGFDWFDFEIFTGEEVCVYFNCLDAEGEHQNVTTNYSAEWATFDAAGTLVWKTYWDDGLEEGETTYALNCIPLPGNYEDEGIQVTFGTATVEVEPEDIAAFLIGDTSYERVLENEYKVIVDTDGHDAYFLHFVLDYCDY